VKSDWSGIVGNPVKFLLGFVSMFFDVIFCVQHYLLYPESDVLQVRERLGCWICWIVGCAFFSCIDQSAMGDGLQIDGCTLS
jgi:hypothetical protein